jgi:hypothetical protein
LERIIPTSKRRATNVKSKMFDPTRRCQCDLLSRALPFAPRMPCSGTHSFPNITISLLLFLVFSSTISAFVLQESQVRRLHDSWICQYRNSKLPHWMSSVSDEDQAFEAIHSLAEFHQGEWRGIANSFSVTPDVAAGIIQRKVSPEYNVVVKLSMTDRQQFSLTETISWDDSNKLAFRSLSSHDTDFDVDAVDGSYSLDTATVENFPSVLSGTEKQCQFLIEHCIATGENRRSRSFALYGTDKSLIRVVVSNEERVKANSSRFTTGSGSNGDLRITSAFTAQDLLEIQNDVDRLVDKIVSNMNQGDGESSLTPSSSPSPSLRSNTDEDDISSRMGSLGKRVGSTDENHQLSPHDISLLELSSGIWLGDAIIRDLPEVIASPTERGRGFGTAQSVNDKGSWKCKSSRRFGSWANGVQKIAWRWMWNFGEEIRQVHDVGKALGSPMDASITKSLAGTVCVDESLSRRISKEDRVVYMDWPQYDSVGFLLGSCAVQVPRYLNFNPSAQTLNRPFLTEFSVFQETGYGILSVSDAMNIGDDTVELPELICSKISRLYSYEGKLKQGCSSFYTFKRFGSDETA